MRNFLEAVGASGKEKTKPYDTAATVTRIEGSTAWVHIDGGVDETPVQLTIDAKPGDTVRVRVSGGQAWLTGNGSAPPTDDTVAVKAEVKAEKADVLAQLAKKTADQAGKTATNYLSWSAEYGLIVSEDATEDVTEMTGGNVRLGSDGLGVYKGQTKVAQFGETVVVGQDGLGRVEVAPNVISMKVGTDTLFSVDMSTPRTSNAIVHHYGDGVGVDVIGIISQTGGPSDDTWEVTISRYDSVIQMKFYLENNTYVAAGRNLFEGMIVSNRYNPSTYVTGVGYYGEHAIIGRIDASGSIVIRNASSSQVKVPDGVVLSFTYIEAN